MKVCPKVYYPFIILDQNQITQIYVYLEVQILKKIFIYSDKLQKNVLIETISLTYYKIIGGLKIDWWTTNCGGQ